jgi:hypothetical protein
MNTQTCTQEDWISEQTPDKRDEAFWHSNGKWKHQFTHACTLALDRHSGQSQTHELPALFMTQ